MELEFPSVIDVAEPVSKAVNEISKTGLPVIIVKNGKYFGLIDERSIRMHAAHPDKEKCEKIAERTPTLAPESTVMDACNAFFAGRFKAIPVLEKGKVQGAITRRTLLAELLSEKMFSRKRVNEIMTSPVATIDSASSIGQARSELRNHNIRRLVVTERGRIAGLLSLFDLASSSAAPKQSSVFYRGGEKTSMDSQPISSYMKKQVETIPSSDSLSSAVKKMLERQVAALIVSDGNYPVGIVTAKDILHAALAEEKTDSVFVSGMPYEQRDYQAEIIKEGEKMLAKLGKNFEGSTIAVHIKSDGSGFSVRARLNGPKSAYNASASDFHLENSLRMVFDELHKMASKEKGAAINKRKREKLLRDEG